MKIKGTIEDLNFFLIKKKRKNDRKNNKTISRTFLVFLWVLWVQFIFG